MRQRHDGTNGIGKRLQTYRLHKKWTIKKLSTFMGLSVGTIWNLENEQKFVPTELTLAKIRALPEFDKVTRQ